MFSCSRIPSDSIRSIYWLGVSTIQTTCAPAVRLDFKAIDMATIQEARQPTPLVAPVSPVILAFGLRANIISAEVTMPVFLARPDAADATRLAAETLCLLGAWLGAHVAAVKRIVAAVLVGINEAPKWGVAIADVIHLPGAGFVAVLELNMGKRAANVQARPSMVVFNLVAVCRLDECPSLFLVAIIAVLEEGPPGDTLKARAFRVAAFGNDGPVCVWPSGHCKCLCYDGQVGTVMGLAFAEDHAVENSKCPLVARRMRS